MSGNSRIVKGIGLFFLVLGVLAIATAAIMFFGAPAADLDIEDGVQIARLYAVILAVSGVFQFVTGFIGMRAAKHAKLLKPFVFLCAIIVVLNLSQIGITIRTGEGEIWQNLIYAATAFSGVAFASRAMKDQNLA